jgi:hypothetical protein
MKLDYVAIGSSECPLIRLYDFTSIEAEQLHAAIADLASGARKRIEAHRLTFVEAIGGCRLGLVCRDWGQGVIQVRPQEFECGFTTGTWDNIAGLVAPFGQNANGFQWLAGVPGEAALLFSATGDW